MLFLKLDEYETGTRTDTLKCYLIRVVRLEFLRRKEYWRDREVHPEVRGH